jgi:hypothetical protein
VCCVLTGTYLGLRKGRSYQRFRLLRLKSILANSDTPQEEPVQLSEQTIKNRKSASPVIKPAVTKRPPILFAVEPLSSCPAAKSSMPCIELVLEPESRAILASARARVAVQRTVPDPTKERVAEPAISRSASAAWTTPQLLIMPIFEDELWKLPGRP